MKDLAALLRRTRYLVLLGYIFLEPVFIILNLYDMFVLPRLILSRLTVLLLLLLTAAIITEEDRCAPGKNEFILPVLLLLALALLTTLFSLNLRTSIYGLKTRYDGLYSWLTYGGLFFLASGIITREEERKAVIYTLLAASVPVCLYGIAQYLGLDPLKDYIQNYAPGRPASFFGSPILTGLFLLFPVLSGFGLALAEKKPFLRFCAALVFLFSGFALFFTYTRAAWLAAAAGMLLLTAKNRKLKEALPFFLLLTVLAGFLIFRGGHFSSRIGELAPGKKLPDRYYIYSSTLTMIKENPFGIAPDTFPYIFPKYKRSDWSRVISEKWRQTDKAHSDFLQVTSSFGFSGAVAYLWLLLLLIRAALVRRGYQGLAAVACLAYLLGVQFDFTEPSVTPVFWIFLGLAALPSGRGELKPRTGLPAAIKPFFYAFLLLCLVMGGYTGYRVLLADNRIMWANYYLSAGYTPEMSIRESLQAVSADPSEDMYWRVLANGYLDYALLKNDENYYNEAVIVMSKALGINPFNPLNQLAMGDVFWRGGRVFRGKTEASRAEAYYRKAVEIEPETLNARLGLVELYEYLGRYRSCRRELRYLLEVEPGRADFIKVLERVEEKIRQGY